MLQMPAFTPDAHGDYNVTFDRGDGIRLSYCVCTMSERYATEVAERFTDKYVGKPYPNGKGYYPWHSVRVEKFR